MNEQTNRTSDTLAVPNLKKDARFYLGMGFFTLSLISPLFIPLVLELPLSATVKGTLSTLLVVGAPELFGLAAMALLGKETLLYFLGRIKAFFRLKGPIRPVGRVRYTIGLVMFCVPLLVGWVELHYEPAYMIYGEYVFAASLIWNGIFLASFFVLGAQFWDKFRALFVFDAYAVIPGKGEPR